MKKVMFLLATLLIGGMMFTGCKKDNPQPTPDTPSTPTETTKTFVYKITLSPIRMLMGKWSKLLTQLCLGPKKSA